MEGVALIDEGLRAGVLADAYEETEEECRAKDEDGYSSLQWAYHEKSPCRIVEKDCSRYNEHC